MSDTPQVTDKTEFENGSLLLQVVLAVITFGLYSLYWTYKTAKTLDQGTSEDLTPILGIIPVANLIGFWQISNAAEAVTDQDGIVIFLLFIFVGPVAWYIVQSGINSEAA